MYWISCEIYFVLVNCIVVIVTFWIYWCGLFSYILPGCLTTVMSQSIEDTKWKLLIGIKGPICVPIWNDQLLWFAATSNKRNYFIYVRISCKTCKSLFGTAFTLACIIYSLKLIVVRNSNQTICYIIVFVHMFLTYDIWNCCHKQQ